MFKKIAVAAASALLAVSLLVTGALASSSAVVKTPNGGSVNVRSSMITHCNNRVASLPHGYEVTVLSTTGDWSYIQFVNPSNNRKMKAYVQSRYLKETKNVPGTTTEDMMLISPYSTTVRPSSPAGYVNLRVNPDKGSRVVSRFYQGQQLTVTALGPIWACVTDPVSGVSGYMMRQFLAN